MKLADEICKESGLEVIGDFEPEVSSTVKCLKTEKIVIEPPPGCPAVKSTEEDILFRDKDGRGWNDGIFPKPL